VDLHLIVIIPDGSVIPEYPFQTKLVEQRTVKYYPTFWQAVNLIVLYIFLQTLIDFPLAIYDYQNGTDWLREPWLKLPVFFGTTTSKYINRHLKIKFSCSNIHPSSFSSVYII